MLATKNHLGGSPDLATASPAVDKTPSPQELRELRSRYYTQQSGGSPDAASVTANIKEPSQRELRELRSQYYTQQSGVSGQTSMGTKVQLSPPQAITPRSTPAQHQLPALPDKVTVMPKAVIPKVCQTVCAPCGPATCEPCEPAAKMARTDLEPEAFSPMEFDQVADDTFDWSDASQDEPLIVEHMRGLGFSGESQELLTRYHRAVLWSITPESIVQKLRFDAITEKAHSNGLNSLTNQEQKQVIQYTKSTATTKMSDQKCWELFQQAFTSGVDMSELVKCPICFDDKILVSFESMRKADECFSLGCSHLACRTCLSEMLLLDPIRGQLCYEPNCNHPITQDQIGRILLTKELKKFNKKLRSKRAMIKSQKFLAKQDAVQLKTSLILGDLTQCPKCSLRIGRRDGCNDMECGSCNYHFCYMCQAPWALAREAKGHKDFIKTHAGHYLCYLYKNCPQCNKKAKRLTGIVTVCQNTECQHSFCYTCAKQVTLETQAQHRKCKLQDDVTFNNGLKIAQRELSNAF